MFQLFLLSLLFSPSKQQGCIQTQFVNKLRDLYPKPGAYCTSSEIEDRWRGELIYEYLANSTGIRVKWKNIVQRSDCDSVEVKFFVNNLFTIKLYHKVHKNIDWVEIKADKTFELKIKALYKTEPKCIQASRKIIMGLLAPMTTYKIDLDTTTTTPASNVNNLSAEGGQISRPEDGEEGRSNKTVENTVIIGCSAGGSAIVLILVVVISLCRWKSRSSSRNSPEEVDKNTVYGTYAYGDDPDDEDYITMEDKNPNYEPSDML